MRCRGPGDARAHDATLAETGEPDSAGIASPLLGSELLEASPLPPRNNFLIEKTSLGKIYRLSHTLDLH
jgi:hypothetical protein